MAVSVFLTVLLHFFFFCFSFLVPCSSECKLHLPDIEQASKKMFKTFLRSFFSRICIWKSFWDHRKAMMLKLVSVSGWSSARLLVFHVSDGVSTPPHWLFQTVLHWVGVWDGDDPNSPGCWSGTELLGNQPGREKWWGEQGKGVLQLCDSQKWQLPHLYFFTLSSRKRCWLLSLNNSFFPPLVLRNHIVL